MGRGTLQTGRVGRSVKRGVFDPMGSLQSGRVRPATALAPADYFALVQSTLGAANIVGHYKLDETTGVTAADATGNGHDGTYTNGPTLGATSLLTQGGGTAVDFDGVNDYVDLGVEPDFDFIHQSGVFTVCAWVEWDGVNDQTIIANTLSGLYDGFGLFIGSGNLRTFFNGSAGLVSQDVALSGAGTYFVCYVGDGVNGTAFANAVAGTPGAITPGGTAAPRRTWIGQYSVGGIFPWSGRIDEVTIANVAATPAQIAALYAYGTA